MIENLLNILTSFLLLAGGFFMLVSALGLLRFPDLFTRMHAAAKTGTLGIILLLIAVALHFREFDVTVVALLTVAFFFLTAPVATHLIGRVAYLIGTPLWERTVIDEYEAEARRLKPNTNPPPTDII